MAWVEVLNEAKEHDNPNQWCLCFQECMYNYSPGCSEKGFRFIWRYTDGKLQPARGQARIPTVGTIFDLLFLAIEAGWLSLGDLKGVEKLVGLLSK